MLELVKSFKALRCGNKKESMQSYHGYKAGPEAWIKAIASDSFLWVLRLFPSVPVTVDYPLNISI